MKKALYLFIAASMFSVAAKAQQKFALPDKPAMSLLQIDTTVKALTQQQNNYNKILKERLAAANKQAAVKPGNNYGAVVYSTMPVASLGPSHHDNMAVVNTDDKSTRYTMPVKRMSIINPTKKDSTARP